MNSPFENHLQWVLNSTLDSIVVIDESSRIIEWNDQASRTFGWNREEALGQSVAELIIPEDFRVAHAKGMAHFLNTREGPVLNQRVELTALRRDGSEFPIELTISPTQTESGWQFAAFVRDLSERDNRERLEAQLAAIVASSSDAILSKTLDGTITSWNRAAEELYGYTANEMVGENIRKIVPRDKISELDSIFTGLAVGRTIDATETVRLHKDGREIAISLRVSPIRNNKGGIIGASAIARDITAQKEAAAKASEQAATIAAILNSTASGIYGIDLNGDCNFANPACAELLGYDSTDEFLGKNMHELIHHSYADGSPFAEKDCPIYQSFRNGTAVRIEDEVLWRKDGTSFPAEYWSHPIYREKTHVGTVVSFHDISHRKALQAQAESHRLELEQRVDERTHELAEANTALTRSNEDLTFFASHAAHDLQSPLRGIGGFATFLQEDFGELLGEEGAEYIERINASIDRMQQLINDLLDFSRIDKKYNPVADVDMNRVVESALAMIENEAADADIQVAELPTLRGDASQLRQLMANLIGNGIKYCTEKTPVIQISAEKVADGWRFLVVDNGIGINREYHERIFKAFQRLHTASQYPGTGLGLAMCQRIVERHQGAIGVESKPSEGSTFFFTLPE